MSTKAAIWLVAAFFSVITAYTFPFNLWEGSWYHLVAFAFVGYTRVIYLTTKGNWSVIAFIMHLTAINNLIDELFFDPTVIDYNEHIALLLFIIIVCKNRKTWIRL